MRYCVWQFGHSTYRRVVDIGYVQPPAPAKLSLQAYPALKILYVRHRTNTETPMVHCTLNGLICRHKHLKDVLVEPEVDSPLSKLRGFCLLPRRACVPLNTSAFLFGHADFQAF